MWTICSVLAETAKHTPLSMSVEEYEWVYRLAKKADPPFLDIGTHYGLSALVMSHAKPGADILTVDNLVDFGGDKEGAMRSDCGRLINNKENVVTIIGDSQLVVPLVDAQFGFALIDGSHWAKDVARDLRNCEDVPTVLVHDALGDGPMKALEKYEYTVLPARRINADWDIEPGGLALILERQR